MEKKQFLTINIKIYVQLQSITFTGKERRDREAGKKEKVTRGGYLSRSFVKFLQGRGTSLLHPFDI